MPSSRPSPWMVSSTAKRVEFSEPKFTTLLLRFYHDPDLFKVLTPLAQNTAVETVHIVSCSLNDEASRALRNSLAENESVDTIVVEKCIVKPKRLKRILTGLAANTDSQISEITFTSCELQDRAVQFVSEVIISPPPDDKCLLKSLTLLDLSVNKIADSGAVALSYLLRPSAGSLLTVLNLRYNRIGDRGAQVLADGLRDNKMLDMLDLGHNLIGGKGGVALAECFEVCMEDERKEKTWLELQGIEDEHKREVLKNGNKFLTKLYLCNNQVGSAGALAFARVLDEGAISTTALRSLDLSCNNIGDVGGRAMMRLAEQRNVRDLQLHGNQVGICNCKHCVIVKGMEPAHWCFEVGVEEDVILDIDENGGNLTSANNVVVVEEGEDAKKRREQKLREEMKKKGRGKPELREVDDFEVKKKAEKAKEEREERRRLLIGGVGDGKKNHFEAQLEDLGAALGLDGETVEVEVEELTKEEQDAKDTNAALARLDAMLEGEGGGTPRKASRGGSRGVGSRIRRSEGGGGEEAELPKPPVKEKAEAKGAVKVELNGKMPYHLSVSEMLKMSNDALAASQSLGKQEEGLADGAMKERRGGRGGRKRFDDN